MSNLVEHTATEQKLRPASDFVERIATELKLRPVQVESTIHLLDEDATVPFIARYRKEATGSLDEVAIAAIRDRRQVLADLEKRRAAIVSSLEERELLTDALRQALSGCESMPELEDLYLPYRPKRRTRASMAKERGLEPLADWLAAAQGKGDPEIEADRFVNPDKDVPDAQAALAGARDILAERFSEDSKVRERLRTVLAEQGRLACTVASGKADDPESAKYRDYFEHEEAVRKAPSHRVLAMFRGETEGRLKVSCRPSDEATTLGGLEKIHVQADGVRGDQVRLACRDGYARLLAPALETECRNDLKRRADLEAIRIFATNLRQLLLAPPLGSKIILALDPGFRTGCKFACLNRQGDPLEHGVINPHAGSEAERERAGKTMLDVLKRHNVEAVAVGNGTAGRETEQFLRALKDWPKAVPVISVDESGASIYSASEIARKEFPDLDLTYRGAISIGRRLADPLAELVKIDPRSIGVGQYQHDVDQTGLKQSLDDVVMECVNAVGVNLNTASEQLLSYVSGLSATLARNIVVFRQANGPFADRAALRKVPRLGPKAFEQCSGFLRIPGGKRPLDASAVHPESYGVVESMARDLGAAVADLMADAALRRRVDINAYVSDKIGLPSLQDIMAELEKPGRDPREPFKSFAFAEGVSRMEDLKQGQRLPGVVTNITAFGAFVDIGVHQDGLVHISQMADRFVKDPAEVVRLRQEVTVTVLEVDPTRKRIALSMKSEK